MKILILNWRDTKHPLSGGAEISLFEHAKYWQKMKNEVTWFTSSFPGAKGKEIINGIKIIRKGSHYTVFIWGCLYYIFGKFGRADIVVDSFHFIPFFTPLYIPSKKIIALINEVAGQIWFDNLPHLLALIGYRIEPLVFNLYKRILFMTGSKSTQDEIENLGIPKKNIKVVHHGINIVVPNKNIKKEKNLVLVFLGRISTDKGIKDVLNTFYSINSEIQNAQLWIIGKEEKKGILNMLLKSAKYKKIRKYIKYWGFVNEKKKFELLKRSWILIHPSRKEGWGLNVMEAGIVGTPTVGYNVEGLRDSVQNGKTGILVSPTRHDLLTNSVINLIENKKMYDNISNNSIKWSKRFRWDTSVKKSFSIIKKTYEKNK